MALYLGSNEVSAASGVPPVVTADDIKSALGYTPADEADIPTVPTALKNPQSLTFTGAATGSYDGSAAKTVNIPTVPTALKNPNALTFAGAVTGSYDGSAAKTVNIPSVPTSLKNPNALTFTGAETGSYDGSAAKTVNIPSVPTSLKNPYALSITEGGTAKTYDGSAAESITIPPVVNTAVTLPASGTALADNTVYIAPIPITTYTFTKPAAHGWAHGIFVVGDSPNITFTGKILGKLPTFESGKQYEFDVFNGAWIVQEVVT